MALPMLSTSDGKCFVGRVKREKRYMRTLLRQVATGLYYEGPDQWTRNPDRAHNFKMIDRALQFIDQWKLRDVELAFAFSGRRQVKRVPLERIGLQYSES
jgi:hypothetical protein